jgi:hypothetical protein
MAKKKSKKSSLKQTEVATPLESSQPAASTTTDPDSTSPPEAQQQPAPTPLEPANGEPSSSGSTHLHDHNLEAVQDKPTELEPSMVAESATNSETTQPLEVGHVDISTAALDDQTVVSMGESQSHVPTEEEPQPSIIETEDQAHNAAPDAPEVLPEAVVAPVVTASEANTPLDVDGEPQAEVDAELPTEEVMIPDGETLDTDQAGAEGPVPADSNDGPSHLEGAETTEAEFEAEQANEYVGIPNCILVFN